MTKILIPALWFDKKGHGPSELDLVPYHFPAEEDGQIPAALGLRVRQSEDGWVMPNDRPMLDGGFYMHRDQVAELHRVLGDWLAVNATPDPLNATPDPLNATPDPLNEVPT